MEISEKCWHFFTRIMIETLKVRVIIPSTSTSFVCMRLSISSKVRQY